MDKFEQLVAVLQTASPTDAGMILSVVQLLLEEKQDLKDEILVLKRQITRLNGLSDEDD